MKFQRLAVAAILATSALVLTPTTASAGPIGPCENPAVDCGTQSKCDMLWPNNPRERYLCEHPRTVRMRYATRT